MNRAVDSSRREESLEDDLQSRLAKRLRQVDVGEGSLSSWMAVEVGPRSLLIPLSHASEVLRWQRPSPVPYTRPWFLGIVSWRGELLGVADLAAYLDATLPKRSEQTLSQCMLLTFNPVLEVNAALLIDHMAGLKSVSDFHAAHAPQPGRDPAFLGNFYTDAKGKTWQELNLQALSQEGGFLSIGL